jgi:hypothetical protein
MAEELSGKWHKPASLCNYSCFVVVYLVYWDRIVELLN